MDTNTKLKTLAMARPKTDLSDIQTKKHLMVAFNKAKNVYITPRFGTFEGKVRITKPEALLLINTLNDDTTPKSAEMYSGSFGYMDGDDLYLG